MKTLTYAATLAAIATLALACDDTNPDKAKNETAEATGAETTGADAKKAASDTPATQTNAAKKDAPGAATNAVKDDDRTRPEHMEQDPSATDTLVMMDLKGKAPEGLEVKGDLLHIYGWTDKYGTRVFAISRYETASKSGKTMMLLGRFTGLEGDGSWSDTRLFKEQVADCEFDITLEPHVGDWAVQDIDGDGIGEVTFAYSAGCRSDVSPVTHKVLIGAADAEKYALRGDTAVAADGKTYDMGGEFKVDGAFAKAPKGFKAHAEKVWKDTVREKM